MSALSALPLLVRRSLRQHLLSTAVTVLSLALASGLVMAVFSIQAQSRAAFTAGAAGFDAVLGARGSQLQLVLNAVFHLETSPGNIPWSMYDALCKDPRVTRALPYAVGDNYRGFRVVGTTTEVFDDWEALTGKRLALQSGGRPFDPDYREAVIGSFAAEQTDLRLGSTFSPYHGVYFDENKRHAEQYTVVGILAPTSTPADRVVWIPLEGIYRMSGHVLRGTGQEFVAQAGAEIADEHKELSAVLLKFKSPAAGLFLSQEINLQGKLATLAYPIAQVMLDLFERIGWMNRVLELVAYLVVAVGAGSILASIYNTMNERRREFAVLRALGASRGLISSAIVAEATSIAALGALLGFVCCAAILLAAAWVVRAQTGVVLDVLAPHPALWWTPLCVSAAGALAGLLPAWKAYRTDVATSLAPGA